MSIFSFFSRILRRQDRRRHPRFHVDPLSLKIDGKRYKSTDWSLGGFKVSRFHGDLGSGDRISGQINFPGAPRGEFVAEVVNIYAAREFGMRFLEISPKVFLAMSGLSEI
jgi:hypothetical protein